MIKIRALDFNYEKSKALNNINIDIEDLCTGLLGPNGSGKTTILKILSGILSVTDGDVTIDDKSILDISKKELSKKIAVVSQDLEPTFDFTVREIIEMGRYPYLNTFGFLSKSLLGFATLGLKSRTLSPLAEPLKLTRIIGKFRKKN